MKNQNNRKYICGVQIKKAVTIIKHHEIPPHVRVGIGTVKKPVVKKQPKINVSGNWLQEAQEAILAERMANMEIIYKWTH